MEELQQTGTLDEYTDKFYELFRKADSEDHIHNDNRVRMYRRGLKPELKKWVKVNADGTLGNTIEVARKAEEAEAETNSRTYHRAQTNSTNDMSTILEALQQLTQKLATTETQNRPRYNQYNNHSNWNSQNNNSTLTCYNCGEKGHIKPNCPKPRQDPNQRTPYRRNWPNQNNNNHQNNSFNNSQEKLQQNKSSSSTNIQNQTNSALLTQLQVLNLNLQSMYKKQNNASNLLLAEYDYLASEKK